jgi:hypothetical protein
VVAIAVAEVLFINARRFGAAGSALSTIMALAFAFIAADGFEHFMRPLDPTRGNATILRRCLGGEQCSLDDVLRNIDLALHTQPLDPRTKVSARITPSPLDERMRIEEAISMLRRLAPNSRYVGMVTDFGYEFGGNSHAISVTAFMATGQWHEWSMTSPFFDGLSPMISDRILRRVAATPPGTLIIISNQTEGLAPLNLAILNTLRARCRLSLVETDKYHSAYRTENCAG